MVTAPATIVPITSVVFISYLPPLWYDVPEYTHYDCDSDNKWYQSDDTCGCWVASVDKVIDEWFHHWIELTVDNQHDECHHKCQDGELRLKVVFSSSEHFSFLSYFYYCFVNQRDCALVCP